MKKLSSFSSVSHFQTITILLFLMFLRLPADTFYVETGGSDDTGDGSLEKPWRLPSTASSIRIGEGTFWDTTGEKINLKPGVSLIGSGQNQTIIVGSDIGKYKEFIYCRSDSSVDGNQEIAHLRLSGNNRLVIDGITIHNRNKVRVHH